MPGPNMEELAEITRKVMMRQIVEQHLEYGRALDAFGYKPPPPLTRWQYFVLCLKTYKRRIPEAWRYIRTGDLE